MSEHEPESVRRLQRAMALVGERVSVATVANPGRADQTNKEGLTWDEWARAAFLKPVGSYGTFDPSSFRPERKAWRDGEDPTEWRAHPRKRREPAPLPEPPLYVSDEPKERPGRDLPFYKRTLDSYDDATITRVSPSGKGYYAALDWGEKSYPGDPDFATYGRTREEAIALAAKSIREDARGIGKFAPHSCLVPGHDLHFRLMKHWADKEAKAASGPSS